MDPAEALPVCRRYLELEAKEGPASTSHYVALTQLGRCLLLLGDGNEALRILSEAKTMLVQRTKGQPHRWLPGLEAEIQQARELIKGASE